MKVGMNLPVMVPGLGRDAILEWARRVDAGPFSHLAAGERVVFPNPELIVTMSAAAAVTERVRILLNVLVLPMHAEVFKAKQLATLDVLSGGRLTVGVGAGAREDDFQAAGADFRRERPLARLAAQVATMRRVWAGEQGIAGLEDPVGPSPVQPGGPEILSGSLSPASIDRAARWADGICGFSFGPSLDEVRASFDRTRSAWREAGRDRPPRLVTSCWFALGDDPRAQIDAYLARYLRFMGPDVPAAIAPTVVTTSPEALAELVRELDECGADELSLVPTTADPDEVDRVVAALA
jgi:alkanesulfonate monooxygenase SsuD/methylene tetrahydromethanopterin reductase-like flavin-dependent oxidoreductase (luciferase family)